MAVLCLGRCYVFGFARYQIAYGTSLWADNFNLVLYDKAPTNTPWKKWIAKENKISCQILINVMGSEGKRVRWLH